jgi:hypothetical protein
MAWLTFVAHSGKPSNVRGSVGLTTNNGWYRYKLSRLLTEAEVAEVKALAGPLYAPWSKTVSAHENCAWLVERLLLSFSVNLRVEVRPQRDDKLTALPAIPELREWVPSFMTPYQHAGVYYGSNLDGTLNILPTGAGKTLQSIVWGLLKPGRILFITRAAARRTICGEIRRFTTCEPFLLEGTKPEPIPPDARFVVVGWESLMFHAEAIVKAGITSVIYDESHVAANHKRREAIIERNEETGEAVRDEKTGQTKIGFRKLKNRFSAAEDVSRAAIRRTDLTATPIRDRVKNLWGQVDIIIPRGMGSFYTWAKRYADAHENPWGGIDVNGRAPPALMEELVSRLSFFTYYVPHHVTHRDLPPKRRQVTYIPAEELSTGRDVLAEIREHGYAQGGEAFAKLAHAAAMKRPRVVEEALNGAFRAPDGQSGGKVCVFTGLRADAEKIAAAIEKAANAKLKKDEKPLKVWMAHGGHAPKLRDEIREAYMAHPGPCVLVGTGDSWGESLNLHDTDLAIIAMLPWTPGQIRQWEGRWVRLGMKRPVLILYLVAEGTADEHVALSLLAKLPAVEQIAKDEVLTSLADDLRGDEEAITAGLLAKLTADDAEEDDTDD